MPMHSSDRILWLLVGLGLFVAARKIPASLQCVRRITEIKSEDDPAQRTNDNVEHLLKPKTLENLAAGRSYEIRSSAIKIIAERCITSHALVLLQEDLASRDSGRRQKAILALRLFVSHRWVQDSQDLTFLTNENAFHAIVTALVNLLLQHENVRTSTESANDGNIACYQMHYGLPFLPPSRYEAYRKQAEQMAEDHVETPKERAILNGISAQNRRLLAIAGFTPLTEYFFNKCAQKWFLEDKTPLVPLDSIPEIPGVLRPSLIDVFNSVDAAEGLSDWRITVSAADRMRHVELLLKALWSCGSIAVQALSLKTAIATEREALKKSGNWKIYAAYCQERADYFRQLNGGLFQQALQSSAEGANIVGTVECDKHEDALLKSNVLPPSPVRPFRRPAQEKALLFILAKLLDINNVETALSAGLVSRWLCRYPFPCNLASSKPHDIVALLRPKAWWSDDPVMAELMRFITSVPSGLQELREFGLTKITHFHNYWRGGDWYEEWPSTRNEDIVMTGGEDTAGVLPSASQSGQDQRPSSSWSRRHPTPDSQSDGTQRRRRREAMVLSDGDGPLTESNILQRENSHAALVPGEEPSLEGRLARSYEDLDREDEDPAIVVNANMAYRLAFQRRHMLAEMAQNDD
jgi:hypothetical protein